MPIPEKVVDDSMYSFFENTQNHLSELKILTGQMEGVCQQMLEMLDKIDEEAEGHAETITLAK